MTEKYKKYKKIVNTPQQWMHGKFHTIKDWTPDNNWWQLVRVPGATVAFNLYLLLWLFTKVGFENSLIEKMDEINEKKQVNNKSTSLFSRTVNAIKRNKKNSPTASAFIAYYMVLLSLVIGGKSMYDKYDDDIQNIIKELRIRKHFDGEIENLMLDPNADEDTWRQYTEAVHPYVVSHIFSSEGVILDSYDDNGGKGTLTVGAGFTINDDIHRNFAERVLQRPVSRGVFHITKSEARLLTDAWLREKIYPEIKKQFNVPLDYKLFVILSVAAYNKGSNIFAEGNSGKPVCDAINNREKKEEILRKYLRAFGGVKKTQWAGLANKYGVCVLYDEGYVQDSTLLQAIAEAPYALDKPLKKYQKTNYVEGSVPGRLLLYGKDGRANGLIIPENIENMLLETKTRKTKGTFQEPVMNYLSEDEVYKILHGYMFVVNQEPVVHLQSDDVVVNNETENGKDFDSQYNKAMGLYKQRKYEESISILESLCENYPNNALVHNDLALMYNKIGEYDKAINHAQIIVLKLGDKSQYGAAQYNAAVAYEGKGDLNKALLNYKLALSNGNNAAKGAIKRIKKNMSKQKKKTIAFNAGVLKIKNKQNKHDNNFVYHVDDEYQA